MAPVKIPFLSCPFSFEYCSLASLTSRIRISCTHFFPQHSTEPVLPYFVAAKLRPELFSFVVWMLTGHLSIGKQEKKEITMVHLHEAARWQLRWVYQHFYLLNSEYQKVICRVLFGFILGAMSEVWGYLIPQRSPKVRERQVI